MPHCYYNQCFLDKMKAEAEKAENARMECRRLASILQNTRDVSILRKLMAAANTATTAAVNAVCIARLYETDVIDTTERVHAGVCALRSAAHSVGISTTKYDCGAIDIAASKAAVGTCVSSALAAAKKAEAITLECIKNAGAPVKCDSVWLETTSRPLQPLPTFAICLIAFCSMLSFAVCGGF